MKKITLLALSLGMTFGVFAQKFVGEATPIDFSTATKAVATKAAAAKVKLAITDFTGDDAKMSWSFEGDTTGGGMALGLFTVENPLDGEDVNVVNSVLSQILQAGIYYPFIQEPKLISEAFKNNATGDPTYLEDGKTYSFWIMFGNNEFFENAQGADFSYAYCNFTGTGVISEGAKTMTELNSGVGIDAASVVVTNVYPNPTSDVVTITAASKINSLEVVNTLGQVVYTMDVNNQTATLDTKAFDKGTYVVRLNTELGQATSKLYVR